MMEKLREMEVARQEMKRKAFESAMCHKIVGHFDIQSNAYTELSDQLMWDAWQAAQEQVLQDLRNWRFIEVWSNGEYTSVYADLKKRLAIKSDQHLCKHGCNPYAVHNIHQPNGWQLASLVESFKTLEEAKSFIESN